MKHVHMNVLDPQLKNLKFIQIVTITFKSQQQVAFNVRS